MKVAATYSHLNGLQFLKVENPGIWEEIVEVIQAIDGDTCKSKVSLERGMKGKKLYSPKALNARFAQAFGRKGWKERRIDYWMTGDERLIRRTLSLPREEQKSMIEKAGAAPLRGYNQTDFLKDRVAIEIQFGKYSFVAYDLFVKHLAFYVRDEIDVGIEILPMKSMQRHMSSGPGCFEGELYNVIRNGRGVPAVPLVLVGIAP